MLHGKATLPLWNEPKHNYVGPAVMGDYLWAGRPKPHMVFGLWAYFLKISNKQNVKEL